MDTIHTSFHKLFIDFIFTYYLHAYIIVISTSYASIDTDYRIVRVDISIVALSSEEECSLSD